MMLDIARQLSKPFSSVRVDMYANDKQIKVGELTNCHESAGGLIQPTGAELWLGDLFTRPAEDSTARLCDALYADEGSEVNGFESGPHTSARPQ